MTQPKNRPATFETYYVSQEGERWPAIRVACAAENWHYRLETGLSQAYFLDEASVLAARCLAVAPGQRVLDLCAAPGGKTLVLAQNLFRLTTNQIDLKGELFANERSADRRARLKRVINDHLPAIVQERISLFGHDASRWGQYQADQYDRVLLDAPCSSERHLIQQPHHLQSWSPQRSERLAQQAYAMALSAAQALKPGGYLVYCTCAIAHGENDGVVARVLERTAQQPNRYGGRLSSAWPPILEGAALPDWLEATTYGGRVLPDRAGGRGPLYIARFQKVAEPEA